MLTMMGCSFIACTVELPANEDLLDSIKKRKQLIVLTTNQPTTYYIDREDKPAGPEFDMTQSFARALGVEVRYVEFDSTEAVITALRNGEGDIAAAGLTVTAARRQEFDFGAAYMDVKELLVCRRDTAPAEHFCRCKIPCQVEKHVR